MGPPESIPTSPRFPGATRRVRIGGMSKEELLRELQASGIQINESGRALFADDRFTTSTASTLIETVEISVASLGLPRGATWLEIHERAAALGLSLCPLELGPHLRLQFLDQPRRPWGTRLRSTERHRAQ